MVTNKEIEALGERINRIFGDSSAPPYSDLQAQLTEANAEIERLQAENKRSKRTIKRNTKFWLRASEKALGGDTKELWLRVEMVKDDTPFKIELSNV